MLQLARSIRLLAVFCAAMAWLATAWAQAPAAGTGGGAEAARRVALVIGNNAYADAPLANPINDARDMAGALRDAGFAVTLLTDVDQRQFHLALREFGERLKTAGSGGAGLFYFAGHGVQIKGRNYLVPVRSHIVHEDEVAYAAVDAQAVLDKMESAGNGTHIVILDACRNNPFVRSVRSQQQGLAQMDAPVGTLVAYATAPGSVAFDTSRAGAKNGLYTTHLLEAMRQRGLKVEDVFKRVRAGVLRASGNKQMPWEASALVGDFYFHAPHAGAPEATGAVPAPAASMQVASVPAAPTSPTASSTQTAPQATPASPTSQMAQAAHDDALWQAARDSRDGADVLAYLNRFPAGRHVHQARQRLLDLARSATASTPTTPGPADGLPRPPPRTGSAWGEGQGAGGAGTDVSEALARLRVEETVRWGAAAGRRRAPNPRRNATGFAEGDRFRYQKTDYFGSGGVTDYIWQVDRIETDGSLWVNDGRQRLDAAGQRRGGNDEHTGAWIDYAPPIPLLEVAQRGAGVTQAFETTVRIREASGRTEVVALSGQLRSSGDSVRAPRGLPDLLPSLKVEVELRGTSQRSDGSVRRFVWQHTYWMALPLLLPVEMHIDEVVDGLPYQSTRHTMIAIDQLSLPPPDGDATAGAGRR
ncbi:MAG: caspase family protein [Rubrivivax sp.]|nr:caspase family protein [Rubrivivax sp.]